MLEAMSETILKLSFFRYLLLIACAFIFDGSIATITCKLSHKNPVSSPKLAPISKADAPFLKGYQLILENILQENKHYIFE